MQGSSQVTWFDYHNRFTCRKWRHIHVTFHKFIDGSRDFKWRHSHVTFGKFTDGWSRDVVISVSSFQKRSCDFEWHHIHVTFVNLPVDDHVMWSLVDMLTLWCTPMARSLRYCYLDVPIGAVSTKIECHVKAAAAKTPQAYLDALPNPPVCVSIKNVKRRWARIDKWNRVDHCGSNLSKNSCPSL